MLDDECKTVAFLFLFFGLTFKGGDANYLKHVFVRLSVPRDQHKKGLFSNLFSSRLLFSLTLSTPSVGGGVGVRGGVGGGGGVLPSSTLNMNNFETSGPSCSKAGQLYPVDKSPSDSFNMCKDFSISSFTSKYAHSNHS